MTDPIDTLVELWREKARIKERENENKAEIAACQAMILKRWLPAGTQHVKRNGATVHVKRYLKVKVLDDSTLTLRLAGDLPATINRNRLASYLRELLLDEKLGEWVADNARLPESLRGVVEVDEGHNLGVRGA